MKLIGMFITAALLLAMLQAALSVLIVIGVIVFVIGFFCRPAETIGLLAFGVLANLMQSHPVGAIWVISLMLLVVILKPAHPVTEAHVEGLPERSPKLRIK